MNNQKTEAPKKCPICEKPIEHLEVSKQMEGSREIPGERSRAITAIVWKPEQEQCEEEIYTCPECLSEIPDEVLKTWRMT